ncbi:MAG: hypothetical protein LDL41_17900 [Coleofasciculus sp. S288]|nr:hypothetical protein [Coleofasciculus sp. S288]
MNKTLQVLGIAFIIVLLTLLHRSFTPASAQAGLESRLSRLESENFQLRSQLSRIESQLSRLGGLDSRAGRGQPAPPTASPPLPQPSLANDPMFKRLATLVIELRERVTALENQLNQRRR